MVRVRIRVRVRLRLGFSVRAIWVRGQPTDKTRRRKDKKRIDNREMSQCKTRPSQHKSS